MYRKFLVILLNFAIPPFRVKMQEDTIVTTKQFLKNVPSGQALSNEKSRVQTYFVVFLLNIVISGYKNVWVFLVYVP